MSFGCDQKKIIPELRVGKQKLLEAGYAVDAIRHLKLAEIEEENKDEPRALLLIAYSYALSTESAWLKISDLETEYRNERARRLNELNTPQIKKIFQFLNETHRVQKETMQILIDKGTPVIPLILQSLIENRYTDAHGDFVNVLTQIGSKGLDELFTAAGSPDTPMSVKIKLIRIIADIGDTSAQDRLETLKNTVSDAGLKMEISTALYQLGNKVYQKDIEAGLSDKNVVVRRAAARAMKMLNQPSASKMLNALTDADDIVRRDVVKALQKHINPKAVDILFDMLTNDSSGKTKKIVLNTLNQYAENGMADGLAARLIVLLIDTEISHHEDRLRIVQLLSKPALIEQIQKADIYENLPAKLFDYFENKESDASVKTALNMLLLELDKRESEE